MATFVLVHPAWFGGWCWRRVAPALRAAGHEALTPTLTGLGERAHLLDHGTDLATHVEDVVALLTCEDLEEVVLVGTSSGGMVVTGVADRVPERIAELVYLDAFVPQDGQCLLDLLTPERRSGFEALAEREGDGWLVPRTAPPPWSEILPRFWEVTDPADLAWVLPRLHSTPLGHFSRPVHLLSEAARQLPRTYVRCARYPQPAFDRFAQQARETPGWRYRELDSSHIPYVTCPDRLAGVLLESVTDWNGPSTGSRREPASGGG
ncbi:alpha/beta fold hydrolase [Geodermatophilus sabuli]|uniref:Pimeloyl-ACP methyl ester carboxylesterase n=1 Tax=Geodermatophilus sabuli TaxID=1564158 RepID=A0A285E8I1_9ACTN|nr:alpha/beta fold hydrolase [Geodermatophilus sabuli]MBB3085258.1 pimeloyl-ACP methyl ester carboxylesterase [Geodermatophilus sabuli]SNX95335.1 Pimeloyl-ACP methyl ester carboxylesterase [Geodermatophilus sabuli]